jgi:hypothetical protein
MPSNPLPLKNDQSVKLSVTVKDRLDGKYKDRAALKKIEAAVERWRDADSKRGIQTVHVAVDDPADKTMKELRVAPVSGEATPEKIKQVIDQLWTKITPTPDYLVLFGGHDIVPMFEVKNPTDLWKKDDDQNLLTDNPYASSRRFRRSHPKSYLIPDRAIGRIPDMLSDPDPAWFVDYLKTARKWKSRDASIYKRPYVICTAEAKGAGIDCIQQAFAKPTLPLFTCPPTSDISTPARDRLSARLHMIKCHGNVGDPAFWGYRLSNEDKPAITSATLKSRLKPSTLAAAMCCYGAQIFSPSDPKAKSPGEWPMASTYLREGAVGFVGSTMKAWVGLADMSGADWIVADFLRRVLGGASIGRAFLESKQDNPGYHYTRGRVQGIQEEKTVIEYVLLGDPSIHPVSSLPDSANELAVQERRQRRTARALVAAGIHDLLPTRSPATREEQDMATKVFGSDLVTDAIKDLTEFSIEPTATRVQRVYTRFPDSPATATDPSATKTRRSLEYYWRGQRDRRDHTQLCLLKVETDRQARPWRVSVMYTS